MGPSDQFLRSRAAAGKVSNVRGARSVEEGMKRENKTQQYRDRAEKTRAQAETTTDEAQRKALLKDVELWERMADYEEKSLGK